MAWRSSISWRCWRSASATRSTRYAGGEVGRGANTTLSASRADTHGSSVPRGFIACLVLLYPLESESRGGGGKS